jgi:hypothetical protein
MDGSSDMVNQLKISVRDELEDKISILLLLYYTNYKIKKEERGRWFSEGIPTDFLSTIMRRCVELDKILNSEPCVNILYILLNIDAGYFELFFKFTQHSKTSIIKAIEKLIRLNLISETNLDNLEVRKLTDFMISHSTGYGRHHNKIIKPYVLSEGVREFLSEFMFLIEQRSSSRVKDVVKERRRNLIKSHKQTQRENRHIKHKEKLRKAEESKIMELKTLKKELTHVIIEKGDKNKTKMKKVIDQFIDKAKYPETKKELEKLKRDSWLNNRLTDIDMQKTCNYVHKT